MFSKTTLAPDCQGELFCAAAHFIPVAGMWPACGPLA